MEDKSLGSRIFNFVNILIMLLVIFVTAYPMYFVLIASVSDPASLLMHKGALFTPLTPMTTAAYELVLKNPMILTGYLNTIFILVFGVAINLVLTIMGAYFLVCKGVMFRNLIMFLIVFTMYFSGGMIPTYLNVQSFGLLDSRWALIIPGAISTTNLIIMRTAFAGIPDTLVESAKLDGASHFRIMCQIMIPLSIPTIAVMVLYYGVGHWNSWFNASIYLRDRKLFPLQLVLREILIANQTNEMMAGADLGEMAQITELIKYALIVIATAPILVLYPFLQKHFVKGVMIGAIKG
ncbi:MAG: carbohydrate ABC transporter permease [Candidatus Merdivicinus sp.]